MDVAVTMGVMIVAMAVRVIVVMIMMIVIAGHGRSVARGSIDYSRETPADAGKKRARRLPAAP
jgi:hypothetical protein